VAPQTDEKLVFIEEPLGLSAAHGFGYHELAPGVKIASEDSDLFNATIVRKLAYGMQSSLWLAEYEPG
jgi:hypothetical protein